MIKEELAKAQHDLVTSYGLAGDPLPVYEKVIGVLKGRPVKATTVIDPKSPAALKAADVLHGVLAFVPARATALVYGLAGSLDDALQAWRRLRHDAELDWYMQTWAILAEVPTASLGTEEPDGSPVVPASLEAMLSEVLNMQWRATLIMLAGFALFATGTLL